MELCTSPKIRACLHCSDVEILWIRNDGFTAPRLAWRRLPPEGAIELSNKTVLVACSACYAYFFDLPRNQPD